MNCQEHHRPRRWGRPPPPKMSTATPSGGGGATRPNTNARQRTLAARREGPGAPNAARAPHRNGLWYTVKSHGPAKSGCRSGKSFSKGSGN